MNGFKTQNLDHLGLVAGMYDELGIGTLLDNVIEQDMDKRNLSIGQAVKAMVLNGLGFVNQNLYLAPKFFANKPVERLIGEGICAEHINDDVLGRTLDRLFEQGVTGLFYQIACNSAEVLGLSPSIGHLDSTSFHADGAYSSGASESEGVIKVTKGYSRDHRPELNQVVLNLIVDNQAGIPLLMSPGSGNSQDKVAFREILDQHIEQLKQGHKINCFVADSALYTKETLQVLSKYDSHWITRVPETLAESKSAIASANLNNMATLVPGYRYQTHESQYAGIKQRWLVIHSEAAQQRAYKTLCRQFNKQTEAEYKAFGKLTREAFACEQDAQNALKKHQKKQKYTEFHETNITKRPVYSKPGKPKAGQEPDGYQYFVQGYVSSSQSAFTDALQQKSCFILATNQLDQDALADTAILNEYKGQHKVEKGFRFLKDPMFLADALFLKSEKRIMALMMIMTLCLLVYAAVEYRIRQGLIKTNRTFTDQKGKATQNPTARWVFSYFHGIHLLTTPDGMRMITNTDEHHQTIVSILGKIYLDYYS